MPRYKLTIAYDGTDFCGWQKQEPPDPDNPGRRLILRTVQGVVEQAVRDTVREKIVLMGASRTDSGVHARGQVAAFTSVPDDALGIGWPADRGTDKLVTAINGKLPRDVLILGAELVDDAFNPIGDAIEKQYTYTIDSGPVRPLWDRRYVFHTWHLLDLERMQQASAELVGEHDFAAFAQINHGRTTTVRTIYQCEVHRVTPPETSETASTESGPDAHTRFVIRVTGSGFLYNMVRIIAGTLMEVGRGKISPDAIGEIINSADRRRAGVTLPPQGLRLEWIRYP